MELFKNYQREFDSNVSAITQKLGQLPNYLGERRKSFLREIETEFEAAKEALDNMKHVANTARGGETLKGTIKLQDREYERLLEDYKRAQLGTGRTAAPAPAADEWGVATADQRGRLISDRQKLAGTTDRVSATVRMANETEQIGRNTLVDMRKQREQLEKGDRQLDEVDDNVTGARRVLTIMKRRVITNKIILIFIILILLAAEGVVVWVRWIQPMIKTPGAPVSPAAPSAPVVPMAGPIAPKAF